MGTVGVDLIPTKIKKLVNAPIFDELAVVP
jgi:hypothetical protein